MGTTAECQRGLVFEIAWFYCLGSHEKAWADNETDLQVHKPSYIRKNDSEGAVNLKNHACEMQVKEWNNNNHLWSESPGSLGIGEHPPVLR